MNVLYIPKYIIFFFCYIIYSQKYIIIGNVEEMIDDDRKFSFYPLKYYFSYLLWHVDIIDIILIRYILFSYKGYIRVLGRMPVI